MKVNFFSKMICLVCLKESTCYLNIFDGSGKDVGIADVLQKHFWFQPKPDDSISTVICTLCWTKISDFHQFYTIVEQAHISLQQNAIANDNVYHKFAADALDDGAVLHCEIDVKEELLDVFFEDNKGMIEDNKESQKVLLNTQTANEIVDSMDNEEYENPTVSTDKQSMRNHILNQPQPEESKTYQCEHCPKKFTRLFILEQHRLTHEERTHNCQICQREFPSSNKLKTHVRTKHGAEMCDICAEVIHGRTAFLRHQLEHAGVSLPKVQCDKCGFWAKDNFNLRHHKQRHIDEGKEFVCNICDHNSPTLRALKCHQRYKHFSKRTYECNVCKKSLKTPHTLKEHMTMHTGEVLYRCPHCPQTFKMYNKLYSHRKKIHPIEFEEARKQRQPLIKF